MKVLFIDTFSQLGHIGFNQIHVNSLLKTGCELSVVFTNRYKDKIDLSLCKNVVFLEDIVIPSSRIDAIGYRIKLYAQWKHIQKIIDIKEYNYIVFSHFDPIVHSLFKFPSNCRSLAFVHNPTQLIDSKWKIWLIKKANICDFLVFNDHMCTWLSNKGINNVMVIPHGLKEQLEIVNYYLNNKEVKYIVSPSSSSTDFDSFRNIIESKRLVEYCLKRNIKILIKTSDRLEFNNPHVRIITDYLNEEDYMRLLLESECVILHYNKSFSNRVSGIMFECIANNIPYVHSDVESMNIYDDVCDYRPVYRTVEDLIQALECIKKIKSQDVDRKYFKNKEYLNPDKYWTDIIKDHTN